MGVDGAAYELGAFMIGGKPEPILVITSRGAAEFITVAAHCPGRGSRLPRVGRGPPGREEGLRTPAIAADTATVRADDVNCRTWTEDAPGHRARCFPSGQSQGAPAAPAPLGPEP
jgi:hypothetical protein